MGRQFILPFLFQLWVRILSVFGGSDRFLVPCCPILTRLKSFDENYFHGGNQFLHPIPLGQCFPLVTQISAFEHRTKTEPGEPIPPRLEEISRVLGETFSQVSRATNINDFIGIMEQIHAVLGGKIDRHIA